MDRTSHSFTKVLRNSLIGAVLLAAGLNVSAPSALLGSAHAQETLKVGVWSLPPGRGNPYTARAVPSVFVWTAMFDKLTALNKSGGSDPLLATSWENIDPTTWRFKLRQDAKFSNGEPFNAEAAKAIFDWLLTEQGQASQIGRTVRSLGGARVVDDHTLDITTKSPDPIFPKLMGFVMFAEPKAWADLGPDGFASAPVGTGVYKADRISPDGIILSANEHSWRSRSNVSRIEFFGLSESAARNQALLSGQIDIDTDASVDNFPALRAAGMKIDSAPAANVHGVSFLTVQEGSPWKDRRLRLAANYAVDKMAIVTNIYGGLGAPAAQQATPISFGYNKSIEAYSYDPAKAKQLIAEAGYADGVDLVIEAVTSSPALTNALQATADYLNAVGINAEVRGIPFPDFLQRIISGNWPSGVHAIGLGVDHTGHLDSGQAFISTYSCAKRGPFYCNEAEMPLIKAAAAEFDVEKRRAMLEEVLQINHDNAAVIFLAEQTNNMSFSGRVQNFKNTIFVLNYHEMTVEK